MSDLRRRSAIAAFGITLVFWVSACGDGSPGGAARPASTQGAETTAPLVAATPTAEEVRDDATSGKPQESTSVPAIDGPSDQASEVFVRASLFGEDLTVDTRRVEVSMGSTVVIEVASDEAEHVHVHGYDLMVDVGPESPGKVSFVADAAGTFEVELEGYGRFLFDLLVR